MFRTAKDFRVNEKHVHVGCHGKLLVVRQFHSSVPGERLHQPVRQSRIFADNEESTLSVSYPGT